MSNVDWRGWRAARCSARAQETVVFPTPPFPTTNVSLATDGFYRKGREGRKELLKRGAKYFVLEIKSRKIGIEFIFKPPSRPSRPLR
jgi:hypothetical protein